MYLGIIKGRSIMTSKVTKNTFFSSDGMMMLARKKFPDIDKIFANEKACEKNEREENCNYIRINPKSDKSSKKFFFCQIEISFLMICTFVY